MLPDVGFRIVFETVGPVDHPRIDDEELRDTVGESLIRSRSACLALKARLTRTGLVTRMSSPTIWTSLPNAVVRLFVHAQSSCSKGYTWPRIPHRGPGRALWSQGPRNARNQLCLVNRESHSVIWLEPVNVNCANEQLFVMNFIISLEFLAKRSFRTSSIIHTDRPL